MLFTFGLRSLYSVFLVLVLLGCGPAAPEDFRDEGRRVTSELTDELKKIKTRNQLIAAEDTLTQLFDELVDVMIRAHEWHLGHAGVPIPALPHDDSLNIELQAQLLRVSRLEGGLNILEKCQESSLHRLDRFEKRLSS